MILARYRPNFEGLTQEMSEYLAERIDLHNLDPLWDSTQDPPTGARIFVAADEAGLDQADVVMTMATETEVIGIQTVEALIGKPIVRARPTSARTSSRGPRRSVSVRRSDPRRIVYVAPENPKKEGSASHARFALYREGMTVDEFVRAGGTVGDVKWDAERGFIRLEGDL